MDRLFVGLPDQLLVVTPGGETVTRLTDRRIECLAVCEETILVGTFEDGLLRSVDGGETFVPAGTAIKETAVTALASSTHDPSVVYAGTEPSGLYRSRDAGASWSRIEGLTAVPSASTWSFPPRPDTHHVRSIAVDPVDPERLFVAVEAGALLVTTDGGETWIDRPPGSPRDSHTLAAPAAEPGLVYAAAGDGFARSRTGGESWEQPQAGLEQRYCWGLAVDPADPERVLVSAAANATAAHRLERADTGCYRLEDGEWTKLEGSAVPAGSGVCRAVFASDEDAIVAVTNQGLVRTTTFGDEWEPMTVSLPEGVPRALAL